MITMTILQPGTLAPDFTLRSSPDETFTLSKLVGQAVVLVFYPADWSPVCSDQLSLYNELVGEFARYNAAIVALSVDSVWCHAAFSQDRKIAFPLLADFEPKGAVSQLYGVYRQVDGFSERALFVIDQAGVIQYSYLSPVDVNPGADGILETLERISSDRK